MVPAARGLGPAAGGLHHAAHASAYEVYLPAGEFASHFFCQFGYVGAGGAFSDYGDYQCSCILRVVCFGRVGL